MANEHKEINLLPGSKEGSFTTQLLNWSLTIGRLLIILVETLALSTFLYRFNLDMKIVDLADTIESESIVIENFAPQEAQFRNLQARLSLAKIYDDANNTPLIFKEIAELGRGKVTFRNLYVASDQVKIEAEAPTAANLSLFTEELKNHPAVAELSVDKVENKTANATIIIVLSATLKQNADAINPKETDTSLMTTEPGVPVPNPNQ